MTQGRRDAFDGIEGELDTWRKTPFDRLLQRREALPQLSALVTESSGDDSKAGTLEEIRALLIAAVAAVEGAEASSDMTDSALVDNHRVIREVFGLTARSKNGSAEDRQRKAGEAVAPGISWHTVRKHSAAHVQRIAVWVNSYARANILAPEGTKKPDRIPARENSLDWLRSTYRELTISTQKLFMLWGVAGTGKTTLAQQFADGLGPEERTGFIRIGRRGLYEEDVRRILLLEGHDVTGWADGQCQALFRVAVRQLKTVRLVVLDEAQAADDVSALIPNGCNVPVLITARERIHLGALIGGTEPPSWQILPLSRAESAAYLINQVPALTEGEAAKLAFVAGGHSETLSQICRYLSSPDAVTADELLAELSLSTSHTLHNLTEINGSRESLPIVVRYLFQQVPDRELAWAILVCMAWTSSGGVHTEAAVEEIIEQWFMRPSRLQMNAALTRLQRLGLVVRMWGCIGVPKLTLEVLRDFLIDTCSEILRVYEDLVSAPPSDHDEGTSVYIQVMRREREDVRPLDNALAEALSNTHERKPALLMVNKHNWALFVSIPSSNRRVVTLYNLIPSGMRALGPRTGQWELVEEENLAHMAAATEAYYQLARAGAMKRRTREGQEKLQAEISAITNSEGLWR